MQWVNGWASLLESEFPKYARGPRPRGACSPALHRSTFHEQLKVYNPFDWAEETHQLAVTVAYVRVVAAACRQR